MPHKCSVPKCKGNYRSSEKVHVFSFPKNEELRAQWVKAIGRKNFVPTKNSKVCDRHFRPDEIQWTTSGFDEKRGILIVVKLKVPRLTANAVPSIMPDCPHDSSSTSVSEPSSQSKRNDLELKAFNEANENSIQTSDANTLNPPETSLQTVEVKSLAEHFKPLSNVFDSNEVHHNSGPSADDKVTGSISPTMTHAYDIVEVIYHPVDSNEKPQETAKTSEVTEAPEVNSHKISTSVQNRWRNRRKPLQKKTAFKAAMKSYRLLNKKKLELLERDEKRKATEFRQNMKLMETEIRFYQAATATLEKLNSLLPS